jgi:quercetin dioxygenase-like cupin family protein
MSSSLTNGVKGMTKGEEKVAGQPKEGRTGHEALAGHLTAPLMNFNLSKEIEQLHQEEAWLRTGRNSKTLVKQPDFRIVLVALNAGKKQEEHEAAARISIQTLKGHLTLQFNDQSVDLPEGHLLALDRALRHDVAAVKESAFLLTISWPQGAE